MKKIIITIPPTKIMIDAMSLATITARMKPVVTEELISKQLRDAVTLCLN